MTAKTLRHAGFAVDDTECATPALALFAARAFELAYQADATDFIAKPIHRTLQSGLGRYSLRASSADKSAIRNSERQVRCHT